jgi:hypothetical protein
MGRSRYFSSALAVLCILLRVQSALAGDAAQTIAGNIVSVSGKVMIRQESAGASKSLRPALPGKEVFVGDIITTPSDGRIKLLLKDRSIMDIGPSTLFKMDQLKARANGQRKVDTTIAYGSLRTGVTRKLDKESHFKVRTSSATMGVRGTEFVVKSEIGDLKQIKHVLSIPPAEHQQVPVTNGTLPQTEITVLEGKVVVDTPQTPAGPPGSAAGAGAGTGSSAVSVLTPGMQLVTGTNAQGGNQGRGPAGGGTELRTLDTQKLSEIASTSRVQDRTFEQAVTIPGATREEEAQAKREERRETRAEDKQPDEKREERREARAEDKQPDEKREERREARAEDKQPDEKREERREARAEDKQPDEKREERREARAEDKQPDKRRGESQQAQASQESPRSSSSLGETRSSGRSPATTVAAPTSGIGQLTTAVTTNVQVALPVVQTIRVADVVPNTVTSTQAVTQQPRAPSNVHTLTIQIRTPKQ